MTDTDNIGLVKFTTPVTLIFPNLLQARRVKINGKETGEPKYGASFLLESDHPDLAACKAAMAAVAQAKWPGRDVRAAVQKGEIYLPISSGDKKIADDLAKGKKFDNSWLAGKIVLKANGKLPPKLGVLENGRITPDLTGDMLSLNKDKFYFGAEVVPQVRFVAYDKVSGQGSDFIICYVNAVLTFHPNKGKRLSGGPSVAETFSAFAGKVSAENPTAGMEDEIPF